MTDIDEAMLIAWVDGELDEVTRRRVDRAVADDPRLEARLDAHRRLRARLSDHYTPIALEPVPAALRAMLADRAQVTLPARTASRWPRWATGGAIAASLLLGLGIGRVSGGGPDGPLRVKDGVMLAQGELAAALDSQLASAQRDAPIRIGLSFRRTGGGWCRSFDSAAIAGVACREGNGWQLQQAIPGTGPSAGYRQAASADPRIMATVDALIQADPADKAQEAKAKAGGWR